MYKVVSVNGNSIRVSNGDVAIDVKVTEKDDGRLSIRQPKGIYLSNHNIFVAKVLAAYNENQELKENGGNSTR